VSIQKLGIRTNAIEAFRAALSIKSIDEQHPILHLHTHKGTATELFATDNYGIVFIPTTDINITSDDQTTTIRLRIITIKIPARATNITLTHNPDTHGTITTDGTPIGYFNLEDGYSPAARKVAPANLPTLPIAPPTTFDAIRAAGILRASGKTPPARPEPIELPEAGYAFRWRFETGGEYVLVSNRMEDDQAKRFKGILHATREQTNP
jgi:hypothetical protein